MHLPAKLTVSFSFYTHAASEARVIELVCLIVFLVEEPEDLKLQTPCSNFKREGKRKRMPLVTSVVGHRGRGPRRGIGMLRFSASSFTGLGPSQKDFKHHGMTFLSLGVAEIQTSSGRLHRRCKAALPVTTWT